MIPGEVIEFEYDIVMETQPDQFKKEVKALFSEGWEPMGDIKLATTKSGPVLNQQFRRQKK